MGRFGGRLAPGALALLSLTLVSCGGEAEPASEEGRAERPSADPASSEDPPASEPASSEDPPAAREPDPLMNPNAPDMNVTAPERFRVRFVTSEGEFVVEAHREWAPHGVDRFYNLVRNGFYDGVRFFRVIEGFVAQFGIQGDPNVQARWREANIPDDPVTETNVRGRLTFAKRAQPGTRSTQLFINLVDNTNLDALGFAPIAEVVEGMEVVDSLYSGYGEGPPQGGGPRQDLIQTRGNSYLEAEFPRLDYIRSAEIIPSPS